MTEQRVREYTVTGMTCDHCVASVREEVGVLAGVSAIDVDLVSGNLRVSGTGFEDAAVETAVAEAGYEVAR